MMFWLQMRAQRQEIGLSHPYKLTSSLSSKWMCMGPTEKFCSERYIVFADGAAAEPHSPLLELTTVDVQQRICFISVNVCFEGRSNILCKCLGTPFSTASLLTCSLGVFFSTDDGMQVRLGGRFRLMSKKLPSSWAQTDQKWRGTWETCSSMAELKRGDTQTRRVSPMRSLTLYVFHSPLPWSWYLTLSPMNTC